MPTYRYECRSCGAIHEEFQGINDKPLRKCPKCGGRLDRLIGMGAGILLKGSGFHNTDYRSSAYQEASKDASKGESAAPAAEKSSGADSGAKSETKSESKKESPKPAAEKKTKKKE
jgi:putative FmdB family regulatory protein